jgi:DNA-binding IclR family transcriptional regulator
MSNDHQAEGPLMRAFAIIDFVAAQRRAVTAAEIAEGVGLPLPTAHRLVGALEERGLLRRPPGSKRLEIGNRMLEISARAIGAGFRNAGRHAILQDLARKLGEQCEIGIVRDDHVVYIDNIKPLNVAGLQFDPGVQAPLHCSSTGKLFLSRKSVKPRERMVRALPLEPYTEHTITDPDRLLKDLALTRKRGWASTNQEFVLGVVGCAVPVFAPDKTLIAGLGISVPVARVSLTELQGFIPAMKDTATRLGAAIAAADEDGAENIGSAA